jgi:hypothetical protein
LTCTIPSVSGTSLLVYPVFDPVAAYPEMGRLRAATAAGDWREVSSFFAWLTDENGRSLAVKIVREVAGVEEFLQRVVAHDPTAPLPCVLLAARQITLAWQARTDRRAQHVRPEQFRRFHDHLRRAEQLLIDVTARNPSVVQAWYLRLTTARGLELGQSEARRRYDRLAAVHPHHLDAQGQLLQQLCPKWGGSWDAVHAFAQECMRAAPDGSLAGSLVAEAHVERMIGIGTDGPGVKHLRQPAVSQELIEAAHRSVLHPAFRPGYGWVGAHSAFSFVFSLLGDHRRAAVSFRVLGDLPSTYPWNYLPNAEATYRHHRRLAMRKG